MVELDWIDPPQLKRLIGTREVWLWGASIVGCGMCRALERNGIAPKGFIDISTRLQGKGALGYPVRAPEQVLTPGASSSIFVVITSGHYEHEIIQSCTKAGLSLDADFISARRISPLDPSVDISGVCNLHCISCPRGNMEFRPPAGFMKPAVYGQVIDKLLRELPFVGNVQLYAWGEPFLNPDAAEIIRMTVERKVLCAISTNLNVRTDFSEAIRARPDWIKISVSGHGPHDYERTHTGGSWDVLLANMETLSSLRASAHPDMYVEVNYHLYKHNIGEQYERMQQLCSDLDFVFRPNPAYLYSLDNLMDYREGKPLSEPALRTLDMLLLSIDDGIARAELQKHLECAEERCFPINWNLNVRFCGAYFKPVIVDDFLATPLADIVRKRNESSFCARCKSLALHRFTSVYLEEQQIRKAR